MVKTRAIALVFILFIGVGGVALAAPSLPVTKPPLQPVPSWTGPPVDPHAEEGQWFKRVDTGLEEVRPYEFYDNVVDYGGGYAGSGAITGYAQNIVYAGGPGTNIISFDIWATITNDTPALTEWLEGGNSHGELPGIREQYVCTLVDTKMTVEFAIADLATLPASFTDPYREGELPFIIAEGEDQHAWYCWTPENPEEETPWGDYYVPTWDFGDIARGASSSRLLSFVVDGVGLDPLDPRYEILLSDEDLFVNRTTSLKISNWIDNLTTDTGIPYPDDPLYGSDVSVFHNINIPEPATLGLLGLGLGAVVSMIRRRRA